MGEKTSLERIKYSKPNCTTISLNCHIIATSENYQENEEDLPIITDINDGVTESR